MVKIVALNKKNAPLLNSIESSYIVTHRARLRSLGAQIEFDLEKVEHPYKKLYDDDAIDPSEYLNNKSKQAFLAFLDSKLVGQILLEKYWNGLASIEDIRVSEESRGMGIGKRLIEHGKNWARKKGLKGLRLETQDINTKACMFYRSCGFTLAGFDSYLYWAFEATKGETALFWYLPIMEPSGVA